MEEIKQVMTALGANLKMCVATEEKLARDEDYMKIVPYTNVVGSIMYEMIGTMHDLAYLVGIISMYMSQPSKNTGVS